MTLHTKTVNAIRTPKASLSTDLQSTIDQLFDLLRKSSPMSDINYIYYTNKINKLPGLKFSKTNASWMPIRNVMRIVAHISQLQIEEEITEIYIQSMKCGCDYFEGEISLTTSGDQRIEGPYRWQWSAFPGRETSYDKFSEFPIATSTVSI